MTFRMFLKKGNKDNQQKESTWKRIGKMIDRYLIWLFPILLIIIYALLGSINKYYKNQIEDMVLPASITDVTISAYPFLRQLQIPNITAEGAIIMDEESRTILFSKNPYVRFSMASTTKIMTAVVSLDSYQLSDVLTVNGAGVGGAVVGFTNGEKVTVENLLYGLLLPSGNDAAYTLARNYPGGVSAFVKKMNEKALSLGLHNTAYADPAGLNDDYGYTTPFELARLGAYALKNPEIRKIAGTRTYTISTVAGKQYHLENLNQLLSLPGVIGLKTGFTDQAGEVLITAREIGDREYIFVVMKSKDRFADTRLLYSLVDNNIGYFNPTEKIAIPNSHS